MPVITTLLPPDIGPEAGASDVIVGMALPSDGVLSVFEGADVRTRSTATGTGLALLDSFLPAADVECRLD
ncbi:hypothetical protein [Nocardia asiatica]|uniref:hypothetical protein n=1 Tax=Nocardia asiatica TaxID=209252 RepID=UPI0024553CED|nr:hypothetical protein [Nocardia asiatica]